MSNLLQVIEEDRKSRIVGFEGTVFTLNDINTQVRWNYNYPTLVKSKKTNYEETALKIKSNEVFKTEFFKKYPELQELDFQNILIAGGCISSVLLNERVNDVDIFVYSLNEKQALEKVRTIFSHISRMRFKHLQNERFVRNNNYVKLPYTEGISKHSYKRTKNCITMDNKYQIILRIYNSPSEILRGFDLPSSAVGFNGNEVLFTPLGKFCYENMINIVDTTRRSTTYEQRLRKYMDRGFNIVLPELDFTKLDDSKFKKYNYPGLCDLPYFSFTYGKIERNKINLIDFLFDKKNECDYDTSCEEYTSFYNNIKYLLKNEYDRMIYISNNLGEILNKSRVFDRDLIDTFYTNYEKKLLSDQFPKRSVKNYIDIVSPEKVFLATKEEIYKILLKQKERVCTLADEFENKTSDIAWKMENPGSQLSGSYNPLIEETEKWYGNYYKHLF